MYQFAMIGNKYNIPRIAVINGIIIGGGISMTSFFEQKVGTETTSYFMPENLVGLFPDSAFAFNCERIFEKENENSTKNENTDPTFKNLGFFLALTGHKLSGIENYLTNTMTTMCLSKNAEKLTKILESDNLSFSKIESEILHDFHFEFEKSRFYSESTHFLDNFREISECFEVEESTTILEIIEKLKYSDSDSNSFSNKIYKNCLKPACPTSLEITLKLFKLAKQNRQKDSLQALHDQFNLEFGIVEKCTQNRDFLEGCEGLLLKKRPVWDEVDYENVERYFGGSDWKF